MGIEASLCGALLGFIEVQLYSKKTYNSLFEWLKNDFCRSNFMYVTLLLSKGLID